MQRWQADDDSDRPWVRRRYRDERADRSDDGDEVIDLTDDGDEVIDLTDDAMAAREVNGRDFTFLSRFRSRR